MPYAKPSGDMLEIGPGHGTLAQQAVAAGYRYRCIEASPILAEYLRKKGFEVTEAFTPPIQGDDRSADVVYDEQVLEHMSGIDGARAYVGEPKQIIRHH